MPAQAQTGQQTLSASGQTFGAFSREIDLNVATDVTYDSNVLRSRSGTEAARGLDKEDVILRPRVEGSVALPVGPVQLSVNGLVGYDIYTRNSELNRERINLTASAQGGIPSCGANVTGGFSRGQSDLRDLSIEPGDPVTSSINVQTITRIGATLYCGSFVGLRPVAMVEYRQSRNSNIRRRGSNVNSLTYGGGVMYSNPIVGQITAFVSKSDFDYPDSGPLVVVPFPDINVLNAGVRLDRRLGARLQVNGQITYTKVDIDGLAGKAYDGINWDISASLRATEQLQITLGTARQIDTSAGFRSNFVRSSIYSADINYAITQRLGLNLSGSYQKRDFDNSTLLPTFGSISDDKFTRLSARLKFQRSRRLGFELFGTYDKRDADATIYDYEGFTGGIGIRLHM